MRATNVPLRGAVFTAVLEVTGIIPKPLV